MSIPCLPCYPSNKNSDTATTPNQFMGQGVDVESDDNGRVSKSRNQKIADIPRVYLLGDGEDGRVIEEFAGQTGYHIRTLPSTRFQNPTLIGAGAGYLAVLDRGVQDVIRITDQYGGAGAEAFDTDGFPLPEIDWSTVADIKQISLPTGVVSGLQILPRGVLIGTLNYQNGVPTFVVWDVDGDYAPYQKIFSLAEPYDILGDAVGLPCPLNQAQGQTLHEFIATIQNDEDGSVLAKIDFLQQKVTGLLGLPDGKLFGIVGTGDILSIMTGSAVNGITDIYRVENLSNSNFMSQPSQGEFVPSPDERDITETFTTLDLLTHPIKDYYGVESALNHQFEAPFSTREEQVLNPAALLGGRDLDPTSTLEKNDSRIPVQGAYTTRSYVKPPEIKVPCQIIANPSGGGFPIIADIDTLENTAAEMLDYSSIPLEKEEKPLFRLIHNTHYDYLSDGGFVYDESDENEPPKPVTSGLTPRAIAVDRSSEPGKLKKLPDLKIACVDKANGKLVYAPIKSLGYEFYGGDTAGLHLVPDPESTANPLTDDGLINPTLPRNPVVTKTARTSTARAQMEVYDGVHIVDSGYGQISAINRSVTAPDSILNSNDAHKPWVLHMPRVKVGKVFVAPYRSLPLRTRDDEQNSLSWWDDADKRKFPVEVTASSHVTEFLSDPAPENYLDNNSGVHAKLSGFFGLNWSTLSTPIISGLSLTSPTPPATPEIVNALPTPPTGALFSVLTGLGSHPALKRGVVFDTDIRRWVSIRAHIGAGTDGVGSPSGTFYSDDFQTFNGCIPEAEWYTSYPHSIGETGTLAVRTTIFDVSSGNWTFEVLADGVPITSIGTEITTVDQITSQAPIEAQPLLLNTLARRDPQDIRGFYRVYSCAQPITNLTLRAKLSPRIIVTTQSVNYYSYEIIGFIGPIPVLSTVLLCSGFAPECGGPACRATLGTFFSPAWSGEATYSLTQNPYASAGLSIGAVFNAAFGFNLSPDDDGWDPPF